MPDRQVIVGLPHVGDEIDGFRSKVTSWACTIDYIRAVILFGSRAKGTAMNSEITSNRVPTYGATGNATRYAAIARVANRLGGVKDPRHACKLFARNPRLVGGGRTAGGAAEFIIANGSIPAGAVESIAK